MGSEEGYKWIDSPKPIGNDQDIPDNIDIESLEDQKKARYRQDSKYRCIFSWWVISVVSLWLISVLIIVILLGKKVLYLDKSITITLLATTTINILGLAYIVLKGLFPESESKKDNKQESQ